MAEQPLYVRMYFREPYIEFTRFIGYQGVAGKDVQAKMKEFIQRYGETVMRQVGEELVDIDGPNPNTAVVRLKPHVRRLAWQLLGLPPEHKEKSTAGMVGLKGGPKTCEPVTKKARRKKAAVTTAGNEQVGELVSSSSGALLAHYREAKERHPGMILLFRVEDFYELFADDAETGAKVLGLTLTTRDRTIPMAGFPHHQLEGYLRKLLQAGHRVAVCDQIVGAKTGKRKVTRVVLPGE